MGDEEGSDGGPRPGLCGACRHVRRIRSDRGSVFYLCRRSRTDPRYPRYPRIPVRHCPGFEPEHGAEPAGEEAG